MIHTNITLTYLAAITAPAIMIRILSLTPEEDGLLKNSESNSIFTKCAMHRKWNTTTHRNKAVSPMSVKSNVNLRKTVNIGRL